MASADNNFPFEICDIDPETNAAMRDQFEDFEELEGFVRVGPKGYFLPKMYLNDASALLNMQTRHDHVFVAGYPRSGTTWLQQLVWLIIHDLNFVENEKTNMTDKWIYFEVNAVFQQNTIKKHIQNNKNYAVSEQNVEFVTANTPSLDVIQNHSFLKTHLPLSLLPPKILETSKVVYVARDPRDVIVSFYHLCKGGFWLFKKDFKTMWNSFFKGTLIFCPYFEHVKEFWEQRHHPNLLFLFYEDIQNDRLNTLRRVADFFNKAYTEEQLLVASRYLDFSNLKDKKSFNLSSLKEHGVTKPDAEPFVRKGEVGGWRKYFDEEMNREAEQWIKDQLRETDLCFPTLHDH